MSGQEFKKVPFHINNSSLLKDLFFSWVFSFTNFYRHNDPSEDNMYNIPDRFNYDEDLKKVENEWKKEKSKLRPNMFFAIWRVFRTQMFIAVLPGVIGYNSGLITSLMLKYIIDYITGKTSEVYLYIIIYTLAVIYSQLSINHSYFRIFIIISKLKAILSEVIYDKSLRTHISEVSQGNSIGKMTSLISSDLEFIDGLVLSHFFLAIPFFLTGAAILLWFNIGVSGLIGLVVAIVHLPLIFYFGKLTGNIRYVTAIIGDSRMNLISNLIEGIKIVKMHGWESPYLESIFSKREAEIKQHKKKSLISSISKSLNYGLMGLVLFVTFTSYVLQGNQLDPSTTFSSVTVLIMSTQAISVIGSLGIAQIFLIKASMNRITQCLLMKNKANTQFTKTKKNIALKLDECTFMWKINDKKRKNNFDQITEEDYDGVVAVRDLNFQINKGELVVVLGNVGAGKTALLLGLLQEIHLSSGKVKVGGSLAFVSEEPWIVSGTIRDNILMGKEEDEELYSQVLEKCCLLEDLANYKDHGDETVIGDRGATLSGGQKSRISLARSVYSNKDIILLDDPLSSVDSEVCQNLFTSCIKGLLKSKTIILATHQTHLVSKADKILLLHEGRQIFFGTYEELVDQGLLGHLGKIVESKQSSKSYKRTDTNRFERQSTIKDIKSISPEEVAKGNVPVVVYFKFFMLGFKNCLFLGFVFLFQILAQVSYLAIIYWVVYWANADDQTERFYILGMMGLVGLLYLMTYFRVVLVTFPLLKSAKILHDLAIQTLAYTNSLFFDQNPSGRMLNRFGKDSSQMDEVLILYILESIFSISLVLGNCTVVIIIFPYILIAFAIVLFYSFLVLSYFNPVTKKLKRMEQLTKSPILSLQTSSLHGLSTIRCLKLKPKLKQDMHSFIQLNFKTYLSFQLLFRSMQLYLEFGPSLLGLINILILVYIKDKIDPGMAAMSISMTLTIIGNVGYLFKTLIETDNYMTSAQRLFEYTQLQREGEFSLNEKFEVSSGEIEVRDLCMRYRSNYDYALKDLSFVIRAGSKTGIVGRTGSGKSSIIQVVFRMTNPESGTVFIDGQDYMKTGLHDLRKHISVIPQSTTLFMASLRDNLDPFHQYEDEEILKVLRKTRLSSLLEQLPKGIYSEIKPKSLSAGQRQLLCLARAILRKNKIVMIDEATANVDHETDEFIQAQINRRFKGCTIIIIAHRLRTVVESDWIIVMEAGTCIETGSPKELAYKKDSAFKKMLDYTGNDEREFIRSKLI